MSIYNSSYGSALNKNILESIASNGLLSGSHLKEKGGNPLGSQDKEINKEIHVNAYSISRFDKKDIIQNLLFAPANGIHQIGTERQTDSKFPIFTYARTAEKLRHLVEDRMNNTILFFIDSKKINSEDLKGRDWDNCGGERTFSYPISKEALKTAFVPSKLISLFKSIFPEMHCIELNSIDNLVDIYATSLNYNSKLRDKLGFHQNFRCKSFQCSIPDYVGALDAFIDKYNKQQGNLLVFHLVRLVAPSDEEFNGLKTDLAINEVSQEILQSLKEEYETTSWKQKNVKKIEEKNGKLLKIFRNKIICLVSIIIFIAFITLFLSKKSQKNYP